MSLCLRDFTVSLSGRACLSVPQMDLPAAGLIGVIGPNGAGKSTFLRALAGQIRHTGTKMLDGTWPHPVQIGFLPQNFTVNAAMTVTECVLLGRREQLGWRITSQDRKHVAHALSRLKLSHLADVRMDQLSGGQQQRVLLAQRISRGPRMLVLDEPTSALDLRHQLEVLSLLRDLSQDMLIVTALHDLTLAGRFADHLVLIDQGQVRGVGAPHHILQHAGLGDCYGTKVETLRDSQGSLVFVAHQPE